MGMENERYVILTPRSPRKKAEVEYASHSAGREVSLVQFVFERGRNTATSSKTSAKNFTLGSFVATRVSSIASREVMSNISYSSTCSSSCGYLSDCSTCLSSTLEEIDHIFPDILEKYREETTCRLLNAFENLSFQPMLVINTVEETKLNCPPRHDGISAYPTNCRADSMIGAINQWSESSAYRTCVYSSASSSRPNNNSSSTLATNSSSSRSINQNGKRRRVTGDPEESENDGLPNWPEKVGKEKNPGLRPFACHFWKRYPDMHHECLRYQDFHTFHRIKNYFVRRHRVPKHCHFCYQEFTREEDLKAHVRARQCEKKPERSWEGFMTEEQEKLLKPRLHKTTEEEKWFVTWDILFLGIPRPEDPYINFALCKKKAELKDFAYQHAPQIVTQVLQQYESIFRDMDAKKIMWYLKESFGEDLVHNFLTTVWLEAFDVCGSKMMAEKAQSSDSGMGMKINPDTSAVELSAADTYSTLIEPLIMEPLEALVDWDTLYAEYPRSTN